MYAGRGDYTTSGRCMLYTEYHIVSRMSGAGCSRERGPPRRRWAAVPTGKVPSLTLLQALSTTIDRPQGTRVSA